MGTHDDIDSVYPEENICVLWLHVTAGLFIFNNSLIPNCLYQI